jgi:putative redox protein
MAKTTVHVRTVHDASFSLGWTGQHSVTIDRPIDQAGSGLGFNGGELLLLAIGGCFANDLQREAITRGIELRGVRVVTECEWGGEPLRAQNVQLSVRVEATGASENEILDLVEHVDAIAEIPNSLRLGTEVTLADAEAISIEVDAVASR